MRNPDRDRDHPLVVEGQTPDRVNPLPPENPGNGPELSSLVEALLSAAQATWPPDWVPREVFLRYVSERLPESSEVPFSSDFLSAQDLYLGCACSHGVEAAIVAFTEICSPVIQSAVKRAFRGLQLADDIQQVVLEKVLFGRQGHGPRIVTYSGRGSLINWVRAVAIREAHDHLRRHQKECLTLDTLPEGSLVADHDSELAMFKQAYSHEFDGAFRAALAELDSRERNILRYQVLDGLEIQAIAHLYRVHRVTMSRWMRRIRERVIALTRQGLSHRLSATEEEVSSIMRLVRSHLDASVSQYLIP